ncbi:MAG TPA: ABC transporter substrate-binding protein [Dongiaceae bacterium]|nr:ABC transporter substrate-binding protein [Dongiaceae bacterium]
MSKLELSRRGVLQSAAAMATLAALGIKPENVLAAEGDIVKVRMVEDIQILDPGYMIGSAETTTLYACMPRLAVPVKDGDKPWGWQPSEYVEKITQDDDPRHISFTLKQGLMWSNNVGELTADDVKYSFERMLKSDWNSRWPTLDHVDVKDKYSGVIVLKSPFDGTFLMGVASESGTILPKAAMEKLKDQKFTTQLPAELGMYHMASWTPKQKLVLTANPDWKGTKPAFSEVHLIDIEDAKAAELAFEAHETDVSNIGLDTAARYEKSLPANSKLINLPGPLYTWMGMNTSNPKLKDIRVRKAIQRAVDVKSVIGGAYAGASPQAFGVVPVGILGHRPSSKYSYNPDEAKALLKEAGVSNLSLEIVAVTSQPEQVAAAQIIQANLADIGIDAKVKPTDSGPFWNLGLESKGDAWKTLELWIMRYRCSPDPSDAIQWFKKDQVGVWNWERWTDPEFETLWTQGLTETDKAKRDAIYVRMQEIMEDTGAYAWLTFDPWFYVSSDKVIPAFESGGEMRVDLFKKA